MPTPQSTAPDCRSVGEQLRDPLEIYLIVNGSITGMTAGKVASQAFQVAQRLLRAAEHPDTSPALRAALEQWEAEGTCTICRVAETAHVFDRARAELDAVTMIDEGVYGCPPGSATIIATWPVRRSQAPRALRHKRIRLLTAPAT